MITIGGRTFSDEILARIGAVVEGEPDLSRRQLSLRVCEWMDWRNSAGRLQEMSCRKALLRLHERGLIRLAPLKKRYAFQAAKAVTVLPPIATVACSLAQLGEVQILRVTSREHSALWRALMDAHHYLKSGPLCGAQLRYLIRSERYGWLGGLSYSACARRVEARDRWIGWAEEARRTNQHLVVNNSRFLIAPTVKVKHLASHVLARCQGQLAADWERVYRYRPVLLETYVERGRFAATCYRAANWRHIGVTRGRGRQGTGALIKDIYVMALAPSWQAELCRRADGAVRIRLEAPVRVAPDWIETELGGANLGDTRLTARLLQMTGMFYAKPTANIAEACGSSKATKAAYRFLDNEAVAWREILQAHYQATEDRIGEHRLVLVVQDTTTLNYARNVTMNANIMQAAVECGVRRILFASSIQVICGRRNDRDDPPTPSGLPYLPLDGESPPNPGNLYALSKLAGEQMLRYYVDQDHREAIAIRFPWTHQPGWSGPGARGFGMIDQAFAHLDVRDAGTLVAAILATDLPGYRIYLPTARGNLLRLPATQVIEKYYPNVPLRRPIAPDDSLVDVSRIECETGWRPAIE